MKYLLIDSDLYKVSGQDLLNVQGAVGNCCGTCNEHTLQELREILLDIKIRYKPVECELVEIPEDQNVPVDFDNGDLPF